jgi:hypothetical protein
LKYGSALILLGLAQIGLAPQAGPVFWLIGWSGVSWIAAGCGYAWLGARVFGKRADGRLTSWNVALLLPFFVVTWLLWHLQIALSREPRHVEVAPGLWLGRRCYGHEMPPGIGRVVDLTAEFAEPIKVREGRLYHCLPILDASIASQRDFEALIAAITRCEEPVYIHCALGHGRSATVAVAALLDRGLATSVEEAEQRVKQARLGVKINAEQRTLLHHWWAAQPTAAPN